MTEQEQVSKALSDPSNYPMFKTSLLWGLASGGAFGLHKYRYNRSNPVVALNTGMLVFSVTSVVVWCVKRNDFFERRRNQNEVVKQMAAKNN